MSPDKIEVNSVALKELQDELIKLSKAIQTIADFMRRNEGTLRESWHDEKFFEFDREFKKAVHICENISNDFMRWAQDNLQSKIDAVINIEKINVGTYGKGVGGSSKAENDLLYAYQESKKAAGNPYRAANEPARAFLSDGEVKPETRFEAVLNKRTIEDVVRGKVKKIQDENNKRARQEMLERLKQLKDEEAKRLMEDTKNAEQSLESSFQEYLRGQLY